MLFGGVNQAGRMFTQEVTAQAGLRRCPILTLTVYMAMGKVMSSPQILWLERTESQHVPPNWTVDC